MNSPSVDEINETKTRDNVFWQRVTSRLAMRFGSKSRRKSFALKMILIEIFFKEDFKGNSD